MKHTIHHYTSITFCLCFLCFFYLQQAYIYKSHNTKNMSDESHDGILQPEQVFKIYGLYILCVIALLTGMLSMNHLKQKLPSGTDAMQHRPQMTYVCLDQHFDIKGKCIILGTTISPKMGRKCRFLLWFQNGIIQEQLTAQINILELCRTMQSSYVSNVMSCNFKVNSLSIYHVD